MRKSIAVLTLTLMGGAATAASAQQGYVYESTNTAAGETMTSVMSVLGNRVKVELAGSGTPMGTMIFDGEKLIASDGMQYYELTEETLQQLVGAMAGAQGLMAQALAQARENMTEEELAELEALGLPGLGDEAQARESSRTGSIGTESTPLGSCTMYRWEYPDGTPDQDLCLSDDPVVGFEASKAAFKALADFMKPIQEAMAGSPIAGMQRNPLERMGDVENLPLMGVQYVNGESVSEWTITSAREADLSAADFGPPDLPKAQIPIG